MRSGADVDDGRRTPSMYLSKLLLLSKEPLEEEDPMDRNVFFGAGGFEESGFEDAVTAPGVLVE